MHIIDIWLLFVINTVENKLIIIHIYKELEGELYIICKIVCLIR